MSSILRYRTLLWLSVGYVLLLGLVAATSGLRGTAAEVLPTATLAPTEPPSGCFVCGIDQTCDPATGQCVFIEATPFPCIEGATFDEEAGFCLPTGPTAPERATPEVTPDRGREPREPREQPGMLDLPGIRRR